jgi:RHS repeat-associated protein
MVQSILDASANTGGLPSGTNTFTYDGNGNMVTQNNAGNNVLNKSITYNLLNLPQVVTVHNGTVTYTYDATGQKLRKVAVISGVTTTTEYIAGIQYKNSTTAVDFIQTEEGKAVPYLTGYNYNYYIGDNLGNTRVTFDTKSGSAQSQQITNYYPFGMEIDSTLASPKNLYLYNRKESQDEFTEYDYGARFYDPVIGRWTTADPLAEKSRRWSPYNYGSANPISHIDPDGMEDIVYFDQSGQEVSSLRVKSNTVFETRVISGYEQFTGVPITQLAPMPNIIQDKGGEPTTGAQYQQNDYQIAASTFLFNQNKNNGTAQLYTDGGAQIPKSADAKIPNLDPTMVKALTIQESNAGGKTTDVLQVNVSGDWNSSKSNYGLTKGTTPDMKTSLNVGIDMLAGKGFKGGVTYDPKTGAKSFTFQGWGAAVSNYNGGGAAKYGQDYSGSVKTMVDNSKKPVPANYGQ